MEEVCESKDFVFPEQEEKILALWESLDAFRTQLKRSEGKPEYVFYDGPPFATGLPHYGHILAGTIKDIVTRFQSANGYHVTRRFGWDCHGLPVEHEIDQKLGIKSRSQVLEMGIDKYNEECRSIVMRYSKEWEKIVTRVGRWIDFQNDYKTLDPQFMESVWWVFKQLHEKGLVYRGLKIGTPWYDGTAAISQCAIAPGEKFTYQFAADKAGTYFYHGHYGLQRSAGFYGSLIVDLPKHEQEPFKYDGDFSITLNDWWHKSTYEQAIGLFSIPFRWVGEPQSLLIEGRGQYSCSLIPEDTPSSTTQGDTATCDVKNGQCSPHVLPVSPGKIYRLRIASVASLSSLNFLIEGHKMTVVEADGNYVQPVVVDNLNVYSGETYSVLITANQDPSRNYWAALNVRGRLPKTPTGLAVLNYLPNPPTKLPTTPAPQSPIWNDTAYSLAQSRLFVARDGYEIPVPPKPDRQIILLNTQNKIDGFLKWALNNISLSLPATPYLAAMKFNLKKAYNTIPPPDNYPADYDITIPPPNPNATYGSSVYIFPYNSTIDVILQNANSLTSNVSEIHPWHLHGHDFWVLGHGIGTFDPNKDPKSYNLRNPPLRNTVPVYPYGWTAIRFRANNPGVWAFHCHIEPHFHMGMGVIFAEAMERVGRLPKSTLGCGLTKKWLP